MTAESERQLADRCLAGDSAAERRVFEQYKNYVAAILYRIMGSRAELEDLEQEVFMRIFQSLGGYRGDGRLASWIGRITARVALAHRARERWQRYSELPPVSSGAVSVVRRVVARQVAARVRVALNGLEPAQRTAVLLCGVESRSVNEVAALLGASSPAVKGLLFRARSKLRADPVIAEWHEN